MNFEAFCEIARLGGVVSGESLAFDLTNMNLAAVVFENVDFTACTIRNTNLSECVFSECNFTGVTLAQADIRFAIFNKCHAVKCKFDAIKAFSTQFVETDLSGALFFGECEQTNFKDCVLENSILAFSPNKNNTIASSAMDHSSFCGDLEQLTLFRLDLGKVRFESEQMRQIVFFESEAMGIDLQHKNLTGSQFIDANFAGANFSHSTLTQCSLKGCALQESVFVQADAQNTLFPESDLFKANFRSANLNQAIWVDATLQQADLTGANLTMNVFQRAQCQEAIFDNSDLAFADFSYATLVGANFRHAQFNRTSMHRAITDDSRLKQQPGVIAKDEILYEAELFSAHLD